MDKDIKVTLKVWRQKGPKEKGQFETYPMEIHQSVSFLEMLDILNERLVKEGKEPIRVFAVCALFTSMVTHTAPLRARRPANYTCAVSMMERQLQSNHGVRPASRLFAT